MESIEERVRTLVTKMTLDEKIAQIGSYWMFDLQTGGELDWAKASGKLRQRDRADHPAGRRIHTGPAGGRKSIEQDPEIPCRRDASRYPGDLS